MLSSPLKARAASFPAATWSALAAAAALVCFAACSGGDAAPKEKKEGEIKRREPTRVRVAPVEQREMVRTLSTTTVVESEREIKLFPRAAGVITDLRVEEGDAVESGAVLAVLDQRHTLGLVDEARVALSEAKDNIKKLEIMHREADARVEHTRLSSEQAARDFERNEKANLISAQALDGLRLARDTAQSDHESSKLAAERSTFEAKAAETAVKKAELALQRAELDDSYMQITAPFAGVIAARSIKVGDSVGAAMSAFVLTDASHLRAILHRPQREFALFAKAVAKAAGDGAQALPVEIRATAEALPGQEFRGRIQLVSPSIDPQSGSFRVTVQLEPAASKAAVEKAGATKLLPGMLVRIDVVTDRHPEALVVQKRALRREGEVNLVFVVRDGRARRVEVEEGFPGDTDVEVVATGSAKLAAGDLVVVVGNRELEEGGEVVIEKASAPAPAGDRAGDKNGDQSSDKPTDTTEKSGDDGAAESSKKPG